MRCIESFLSYRRGRMRRLGLLALTCSVVAGFVSLGVGGRPVEGDLQSRGQAILERMAEVNRYWLLTPPEAVRNYSYDFGRPGEEARHFEVSDPGNTDSATRCGITYSTAMRVLARDPSRAVITEIEEKDGAIRIGFRFEETVKGACGNGLAGSWYGYFNLGVTGGTLWLDAERKVPLELICDILTERFGEYVEAGDGHYVPLNITVTKERPGKERMHYDWKFRLYDPGLWLFDISFYSLGFAAEPVVATQATNVRVNESDAKEASTAPMEATVLAETDEARRARVAIALGQDHVAAVVEANRAWLLPPLELRRGLAYDYRQEGLYRERVLFDDAGRIMVQLEGTQDGPEAPTRQLLFLADGTEVKGNHGDAFVRESPPPQEESASGEEVLHRRRSVNNLATGLGWDCALTHMARAPSDYLAVVEPGEDAGTYVLVLRSRSGDTKIFTGTMLTFTSWAYLHDVRYSRSEIVCDGATHRPLEEKDYDRDGKLVASYTFSEYQEDPDGAAPGRIRAIVPFEKGGNDQSLEMDAAFAFVQPGVWMLRHVHSEFRGGDGGSTGAVNVLPADPAHFQPIGDMVARLQRTRELLAQIDAASPGPVVVPFKAGEPLDVWAKADWGDIEEKAVIAVRQAQLDQATDGGLRVTLDLISTAYWKEYTVAVDLHLRDADGITLATQSATATVRAEQRPGTSQVVVEFPKADGVSGLAVVATVQRRNAEYHGHGMWMRFGSSGGREASRKRQ